MSEQPVEPYVAPREQDASSSMLLGFGLFGLFVLLFAGTVVVGLVYLALD